MANPRHSVLALKKIPVQSGLRKASRTLFWRAQLEGLTRPLPSLRLYKQLAVAKEVGLNRPLRSVPKDLKQ